MTNSRKNSFFPSETLNWMLDKAEHALAHESINPLNVPTLVKLILKLGDAGKQKTNDKKNRWFGYYQRVGEELGIWKLDDIKVLVRKEREVFDNMDEAARTRKMLKEEADRCKNLYTFLQEEGKMPMSTPVNIDNQSGEKSEKDN
jgi:hypothetical protein